MYLFKFNSPSPHHNNLLDLICNFANAEFLQLFLIKTEMYKKKNELCVYKTAVCVCLFAKYHASNKSKAKIKQNAARFFFFSWIFKFMHISFYLNTFFFLSLDFAFVLNWFIFCHFIFILWHDWSLTPKIIHINFLIFPHCGIMVYTCFFFFWFATAVSVLNFLLCMWLAMGKPDIVEIHKTRVSQF